MQFIGKLSIKMNYKLLTQSPLPLLYNRMLRMRKHKAGSFGIVGVNPNIAAKQVDGNFTNGKPQAGALGVFVEFFETLEHHFLLVEGNAATGIGDAENELVVLGIVGNAQGNGAFGGELGGVGEQIYQHLLQALHIGGEGVRGKGGVENERQVFVARVSGGRDYVFTQCNDFALYQVEGQTVGF